MGWNFANHPTHLLDAQVKIKEMLHGEAPTLIYKEDNIIWDPLGTAYTIKEDYDSLLDDFVPSPSWVLWKQV